MLHSTDAFGTAGGKALTDALGKLGAPPVLDQGYANQSQDFTPVVLGDQAVRRRHPRLLLHLRERSRHLCPPVAPARRQHSVGRLALDRQYHRVEARGSGALQHLWRRRLRRRLQRGLRRRSARLYRDAVKVAPDNQSSWPYDAVNAARAAINKARFDRARQDPRGHPGDQEVPGRRGRIQLRQERRRACTATTSSRTRRATSSSTSTSSSTTDRSVGLSGGQAGGGQRPTSGGGAPIPLNRTPVHGSRPSTAVYRHRHRRRLRAGRAGLRADLPRHQCGEFRAGRILDGGRLSDGGVRGRSGLAVLAVVPDRAAPAWRCSASSSISGLLSVAPPHVSPGDHRHHRRLDPARQFGARDLRPATAGAGGLVRDARASSSARSISTASIC